MSRLATPSRRHRCRRRHLRRPWRVAPDPASAATLECIKDPPNRQGRAAGEDPSSATPQALTSGAQVYRSSYRRARDEAAAERVVRRRLHPYVPRSAKLPIVVAGAASRAGAPVPVSKFDPPSADQRRAYRRLSARRPGLCGNLTDLGVRELGAPRTAQLVRTGLGHTRHV